MPALDVISEDFQLRFVVCFGSVRQQQRVRHHASIGFLRTRTHDDLALENASTFVVEHRLEDFAAVAAGHCVVEHERSVRMLTSPEQICPSQTDCRALAGAADEQLIACHLTAEREREIAELDIGTNGRGKSCDMECRSPIASHLDVFDAGTITNEEI